MARGLLLGVSGAPEESLGAQDYDASENLAVDSCHWRGDTFVLRGIYGTGGACPRRDVPARGGGSAISETPAVYEAKPVTLCQHCGGDTQIANPTGTCNHIYYPDNCDVCSRREAQEKQMNAPKTYSTAMANALGKMPGRVVRRRHYEAEVLATRKALWWVIWTLAVSLAGNVWLLLIR